MRVRELCEFADLVCVELEGMWRVDRSTGYLSYAVAFINGPEGERLVFRENDGRLTISGDYPAEAFRALGESRRHAISVSINRTFSAIAREINRRLLPDYRVTLAEVCERLTARAVAAEKLESVLSSLQEEFPRLGRVNHAANELYFNDRYRGDLRLNNDGSVCYELRFGTLPVDVVRRIMAALADE